MIGKLPANGSRTLTSVNRAPHASRTPAHAKQTAQIYREWTDEHHRGIESRTQPGGIVHTEVQSAAQVRQTHAEQVSGACCVHRPKQHAENDQYRMGRNR
jgi:hypothetical protein